MKDCIKDTDIAQNINKDVQTVLGQAYPRVSVIVPTYNSDVTLDICLKAIRNQTYPDIEVIVVDNYSEDNTVSIAKKSGARVFLIEGSPSQSRNFGVKKSNGRYVLFLDSDIELLPNTIAECVKQCEVKGFDAVHIPVVTVGKDFWAKCVTFEDLLHIKEPNILTPTFFSRRILHAVGGMNGNLIAGEDWDLWVRLRRMHAKSTFIEPIQKHYGFKDLPNYLKKKYRWYKTFGRYVAKHKSFALKQEALLTLYWSPFKKSLVSRYPQYFLGFLVLKMMRYLLMFIALLSK